MMQLERQVMLRQQRNNSRIHWGRVWFWGIGIFLVLSVIVMWLLYGALAPMRTAQNEARRTVFAHTDLTHIAKFYVDDRQKTTYAVIGQNDAGIQEVALFTKGQTKNITVIKRSSGMSDAQIQNFVQTKYKPKDILKITPSLYEKTPVWEVTYTDRAGRLSYLTLDFKTGKAYRTISGL